MLNLFIITKKNKIIYSFLKKEVVKAFFFPYTLFTLKFLIPLHDSPTPD